MWIFPQSSHKGSLSSGTDFILVFRCLQYYSDHSKVVSQLGLASGQDPKVNREKLKQTRILPHALRLIGAFLHLVLRPQRWASLCLC